MDLKKYKNTLFYFTVTGGFTVLIYWIITNYSNVLIVAGKLYVTCVFKYNKVVPYKYVSEQEHEVLFSI